MVKTGDVTRREMPRWLSRALWTATVVLVTIGAGAAVGRSIFPDDFVTRAEPVRHWLMDVFHRNDPFALQRPMELARVDGRFAAHRVLTLLHVLPGGVFLLMVPFQFSTWIRTRYLQVHRWSGRLLLAAVFVSVLPGLYFGILIPYGGPGEAVAIAVFGGLLLFAIFRGFLAIRRQHVARHREWMIRAFAVGIAISTVRLVAVVFDAALTPAGVRPPDLFVYSLWAGWIMTIGVAESWIWYTRSRRQSRALA